MGPGEFVPVIAFFATIVIVVRSVINSPKNKARAEILKTKELAQIENQRNYLSAIEAEELDIKIQSQEERIAILEEEIAFLKKLAERK